MGPRNDLKAVNPDFEARIQTKLEKQYFMKHMGFRLTEIQAGFVCGEMDIEQIHLQQNNFFHGGITATSADIVMGFAAFSLLDTSHSVVTADLHISYHLPGVGHRLLAKGWVEKPGSVLHFCCAEIFCEDEKNQLIRIATAHASMAVLKLV